MKTFAVSLLTACCAVFRTGVAKAEVRPQIMPVSQPPEAAEKSPPGDIPDNQVFVTYQSPLGFAMKVPEGWARRETLNSVEFTDKYNRIAVAVTSRELPPTPEDLQAHEIRELRRSGGDAHVSGLRAVRLPSGNAFVVSYASNSARNPVTNKVIRLDSERYFFWKDGKLATLTLSAPAGADNTDQWQLMTRSFSWQ